MRCKILILCTGNSCRSQMAQGWINHFHSDKIECQSAGIEKHGLNPLAVLVMDEVGVDISHYYSKTINDIQNPQFDFVFTVCDHASENCPYFPGPAKIIHVGFEDPPKLALHLKNKQDQLNCYRKVRDQIKQFALNINSYLKEC